MSSVVRVVRRSRRATLGGVTESGVLVTLQLWHGGHILEILRDSEPQYHLSLDSPLQIQPIAAMWQAVLRLIAVEFGAIDVAVVHKNNSDFPKSEQDTPSGAGKTAKFSHILPCVAAASFLSCSVFVTQLFAVLDKADA